MADWRHRAPDPGRKSRKYRMTRHTPGVILRKQCQNPPHIPREDVAGRNKKEQDSGRERPRRNWEPHGNMVEVGQSGDLEKKADEVFHCPICFKEFVCKYGLETHIETHSDNPLRCSGSCL
nr:ras-responsive element-binding protein 1-like isoform X2 [Microcebus murinus]